MDHPGRPFTGELAEVVHLHLAAMEHIELPAVDMQMALEIDVERVAARAERERTPAE